MNKFLEKFNIFKEDFPLSPLNSLLRVMGVKKSFSIHNRRISVLRQVDFQVEIGETIAITGASGSGKSTLLNLLAGIDIPTEGKIFFFNYFLNHLSETQLAILRSKFIGFVFQQHNLIKELTVLENVLVPAMIRPHFIRIKDEKEKLAMKLLNKIGLSNRLDHYVGELSGGEAQRVAIVRAFINNPRLILADEPTGNLDLTNSFDVFSLLKDFARTQSSAVIMVTHSLELAQQCGRIYNLKDGILTLA